jgi:serine/threonine protein kinase
MAKTMADQTLIGKTIGNYNVRSLLGEGGMGAVYLAEHPLIGRRAAVKVLLPEFTQRRDVVDRFFNEAKACAALQHPGVVEIYDFGKLDDGGAYIIMEYLDGEPLSKRLARGKKLPPRDALAVIHQVAKALSAAHARGIVHRDLKPDNVFIVRDKENPGLERVKILDFGIAKLTEEGGVSSGQTRTGALLGTPAYMSPEQCEGAGHVDHRSDIYAMGVILYEMLCGQVPFKLDGFGKILAAHLHVEPAPARTHEPSLPVEVEQLVMRMLIKDRAKRPQTCAEVAAAVEALAGSLQLFAQPIAPGAAPSTFPTPAPSATGSQAGPAPLLRTPAPSLAGAAAYTPAPAPQTTLSESVTTFRPPTRPSAAGSGPRRGKGMLLVAVVVVILAAAGGGTGVFLYGGGELPFGDGAASSDDDEGGGTRPRALKSGGGGGHGGGAGDDDDGHGGGDKGDVAHGGGHAKGGHDEAGSATAKTEPEPRPESPDTGATAATAAPASAAPGIKVVAHEIDSKPAKARVYRMPENKLMGETPCKLLVEAGEGEVEYAVRLAGYGDESVKLAAGADAKAAVALKKAKVVKPKTGGPDEGMGLEIPR